MFVLRQQVEAKVAARPAEERQFPPRPTFAPPEIPKRVPPALPESPPPARVVNPTHFTDEEIEEFIDELIPDDLEWIIVKSVADDNGRPLLRNDIMVIPDDHPAEKHPAETWRLTKSLIVKHLVKIMLEFGNIKSNLGMSIQYVKTTKDANGNEVHTFDTMHTRSKLHVLTLSDGGKPDNDQITQYIDQSAADIAESVETFLMNSSGWRINRVESLFLEIDRYRAIRGASYIPSPSWIVNKKCCNNVLNTDQDCFRYALIAAVDPPEKKHSVPWLLQQA